MSNHLNSPPLRQMGLAGRAEQGMGQTESGAAASCPGPDLVPCDPAWPRGTARQEVCAGGDADPGDLQGWAT